MIHLWHILTLESCRCQGALLLLWTYVFPLGLPSQRRGCLFCYPSCKAIRVASEIRPLVLIQTSVVIEWVANSSLPSRHHPLCLLHLPSALAILWDSIRGGWDLFLAPSGWVRRSSYLLWRE